MKFLLLPVIAVFCCSPSFTQSIGIGTNNPHSSAVLHVNSNNKGILFPSVSLSSVNDNVTIPNAATSLVVYNTNSAMPGGRALYVNTGLNGSPNWQSFFGMTLPYQGNTSTDQYAFQVNNTTAGANAVSIIGYAPTGKGLYGSSVSGVGVYASSNTGHALDINGRIHISGNTQTPGEGKVLTSDANGNASWKGGVAFGSTGIQPDGAASFETNKEKKIPFYTEDYDYGGSYNPSTVSPYSTFTAPYAGVYHFDAMVRWKNVSSSSSCSLHLITNLNGTITTRASSLSPRTDTDYPLEFHGSIELAAGEQVYFTLFQTTGSTQSLLNYNEAGGKSFNRFSGYAVLTY